MGIFQSDFPKCWRFADEMTGVTMMMMLMSNFKATHTQRRPPVLTHSFTTLARIEDEMGDGPEREGEKRGT